MSKMRLVFAVVAALISSSWAKADQPLDVSSQGSVVESILVDAVNDCAVVSSSNENAELDFYESECKAFGGYRLKIKGSDLRYSPELSYGSKKIDLKRPFSFHDMAETSLEWLYQREVNDIGLGKIRWVGLIYELEISEEEKTVVQFYGVRLSGRKSCVIAIAEDKEIVRKSLLDPISVCK